MKATIQAAVLFCICALILSSCGATYSISGKILPAESEESALTTPGIKIAEYLKMSVGQAFVVAGGTYTLTVEPVPAYIDETLIWSSFDDRIITVTQEGMITALSIGSSMVTVSTPDGKVRSFTMIDVLPAPTSIIDVPFISQVGKYPNCCEAVSAVMALNYAGIDISVDDFISEYLDMAPLPAERESDGALAGASPWKYYLGDPRGDGYFCYSPCIVNAMNKFVDTDQYDVITLKGESLESLCQNYINNDTPVIVWATQYMTPSYEAGSWYIDDTKEEITWIADMHCLLLTGFDDSYYYFNDPIAGKSVAYAKALTETAYKALYAQAIVIRQK